MTEIILKTDEPGKAVNILFEALETEERRLQYSLNLANNRLKKFEEKYSSSLMRLKGHHYRLPLNIPGQCFNFIKQGQMPFMNPVKIPNC